MGLLNVEILRQMSPEKLNEYMISLVQDFHDFAAGLANGSIQEFAPPFTGYYASKQDVWDFCNEFFKQYFNSVQGLKSLDIVNLTLRQFVKLETGRDVAFDLLRETESVIAMILDTVVEQFKGFPCQAYERMEQTMIANDCHLLNLLPQLYVKGIRTFRVRKGTSFTKRKDLFHTPYELRNLCASYRFSTLGYPSLYLAGSLETALKETNVVDINEYSFSCFLFKDNMHFLDLSLPSGRGLTFWEEYSLVLFYPLIVACALKVKEPERPFKPEYIIPQLLMQVVRLHGEDFDGVSYTSTKFEHPDYKDPRQRNYVAYVPYGDRQNGYSQELAAKLMSTVPMPCGYKGMPVAEIEDMCKSAEFDVLVDECA